MKPFDDEKTLDKVSRPRRTNSGPTRPSHIPASFRAACLRAIAKKPEDRFATAYEFAESLNPKIEVKFPPPRYAYLFALNPGELEKLGVEAPQTRGEPRDLRPEAKSSEPAQTPISRRTHLFHWAAFTLSGDWR